MYIYIYICIYWLCITIAVHPYVTMTLYATSPNTTRASGVTCVDGWVPFLGPEDEDAAPGRWSSTSFTGFNHHILPS